VNDKREGKAERKKPDFCVYSRVSRLQFAPERVSLDQIRAVISALTNPVDERDPRDSRPRVVGDEEREEGCEKDPKFEV